MSGKRETWVSAKVSADQKADIVRTAAARGMTVSSYLMTLHRGGVTPAETPPHKVHFVSGRPAVEETMPFPESLVINHVDDIGPDPWRRDNGALQR